MDYETNACTSSDHGDKILKASKKLVKNIRGVALKDTNGSQPIIKPDGRTDENLHAFVAHVGQEVAEASGLSFKACSQSTETGFFRNDVCALTRSV